MHDLDQWLRTPAAPGRLPPWAGWYVQRWGRDRIVPSKWSPERVEAARQAAVAICREHGISPYPRRRLSADEVRAVIASDVEHIEDTPEADGTRTLTGYRIRTLDGLLSAADVDPERWGVESFKVNTYEAQAAGGGVLQLWQVKATLRERAAWLWQPVEPAKTYPAPDVSDPRTTLVIPDSQNGYRWVEDMRRLEPLHDRRAWDLAVQIAKRAQPDRIVLLGDMVDFAEGSKRWPVSQDLRATTQPTIEELHWWLARLRAACPDAAIVYLEGNHEDRIDRALSTLTPELHGLRAAGEGEPLISWRRLLALSDLGIEYVGPYSADAAHVLDPHTEARHGHKVTSGGGATAARVVRTAHVSQIFGHIHRLEYAERTLHGPDGRRVVWAASPGTIARVDGVVPAVSGRVDWQQGLAWLSSVDGATHCQLVPIRDGVACWRGDVLTGETHSAEIAEETGWPQLR